MCLCTQENVHSRGQTSHARLSTASCERDLQRLKLPQQLTWLLCCFPSFRLCFTTSTFVSTCLFPHTCTHCTHIKSKQMASAAAGRVPGTITSSLLHAPNNDYRLVGLSMPAPNPAVSSLIERMTGFHVVSAHNASLTVNGRNEAMVVVTHAADLYPGPKPGRYKRLLCVFKSLGSLFFAK